MRGTGPPVAASPAITRYSRSIAWADGNSLPGGLRRRTYCLSPARTRYVGFDCPPWNCATESGPANGPISRRMYEASAGTSKACTGSLNLAPAFAAPAASDGKISSIHDEGLPRDMTRRLGREEQHGPLEVLVATQAAEWRTLAHDLFDAAERFAAHLRREEAGTDRVHVDVVASPLGGERARHRKQRAFAGVVCDGVEPPVGR